MSTFASDAPQHRDSLAFIMAAEEAPGLMDAEEYAEGMVGLIRSNLIHSLQGSWQRIALSMVESGVITRVDGVWQVNHDELERVLEYA
jgi:hypothetical protein